MLEKVKAVKDGVILAGDGHHDSMGHSAKYGAYTIFCCTLPMILHFTLVQVKNFGKRPDSLEYCTVVNLRYHLL